MSRIHTVYKCKHQAYIKLQAEQNEHSANVIDILRRVHQRLSSGKVPYASRCGSWVSVDSFLLPVCGVAANWNWSGI